MYNFLINFFGRTNLTRILSCCALSKHLQVFHLCLLQTSNIYFKNVKTSTKTYFFCIWVTGFDSQIHPNTSFTSRQPWIMREDKTWCVIGKCGWGPKRRGPFKHWPCPASKINPSLSHLWVFIHQHLNPWHGSSNLSKLSPEPSPPCCKILNVWLILRRGPDILHSQC